MTQQHFCFRVRGDSGLQNKSLACILRNDITRRLDDIEPQKYSAPRNTSFKYFKTENILKSFSVFPYFYWIVAKPKCLAQS